MFAVAAASLGQAAAQDVPPAWRIRPTTDQLQAVYPRAAQTGGKGGEALLSCKVTVQGVLADCKVESESPPGVGFGAAALALTPQFLMAPATRNGVPVESLMRLPLKWDHVPLPRSGGGRAMLSATASWAEAPTWDDVAAAYPAKARAAGVGGRSTVFCDFRLDGGLTVCRWMSVDPPGMDFEKAALALTKKFKLDARPGRASLQIPIAFDPVMLSGGRRTVSYPTWLVTPSAQEIAAAFTGLAGPRARLSCKVVTGGRLDACKVVSEQPAGAGAKALGLMPLYRMSAWTSAGFPAVGGEVDLVVDAGR